MMGNYHVRFGGRERRVLFEARPSRPNAEMTSAFLCAEMGIDNNDLTDNQAAYLQGWINALKGDSKLIITAASAAQKAFNFIASNFSKPVQESVLETATINS